MPDKTAFDIENAITVELSSHAASGVVDLVESITFGSDGLRYRRLDVRSQLARFIEPCFFHAYIKDELAGVYVLDKRQLLIQKQPVNAFYRGVLAVAEHWQGTGVGAKLVEAAKRWMDVQSEADTVFSYGCIDESNHRSLNLLKRSGATVGPLLSMYVMYRQWPSATKELQDLDDVSSQEVLRLLLEQNSDCSIQDVSKSPLPGFVLQDEKGIVMSARVTTSRFCIMQMGLAARLGVKLFVNPSAAARRRFDPHNFTYLSLSNVFIRRGCESQWRGFLGALLARHDCHFAAIYITTNSALFHRLQKANTFTRFLYSNKGSIRLVCSAYGQHAKTMLDASVSDDPMHLWPVDA